MILDKLLTPKWKHRNPTIRKQALLAMDYCKPPAQAIYEQVVKLDSDRAIRQLAIKRLLDIDKLLAIREQETDKDIVAAADKRFRQLLAGQDPCCEQCPSREQRINSLKEQPIIEFVALQAVEPVLRITALKRVTRQALCGDIALADLDLQVRLAALERVTQISTLERVAKNAKRKDKRIYAIAQERLDEFKSKQQIPIDLVKKAKFYCARIDALVLAGHNQQQWLENEDEYKGLKTEWKNLLSKWGPAYGKWDQGLTERFTEAAQHYDNELATYKLERVQQQALEQQTAPIRAAGGALCEQLEQCLNALAEKQSLRKDNAQSIDGLLGDSIQQWQSLKDKKGHLPNEQAAIQSQQERFDSLVNSLRRRIRELGDFADTASRFNGIAANVEGLLQEQFPDLRRRFSSLRGRFSDITVPANYKPDEAVMQRIDAGLKALSNRIEIEEKQHQDKLSEFSTLVVKLETHLKTGAAKQAMQLAGRGRKLIMTILERDRNYADKANVHRRFQEATKQVNELQDWHKWSNEPVKLALCESIEQLNQDIQENLSNSEYDFVDAANRIKAARSEWKTLSIAETKPSRALWQRFDKACTEAYEPCHQYYQMQSQQRDKNLVKRQETCQQLEDYYQTLQARSPETIDWKALENILKVARQEWKSLGIIDHSKHSKIQRRFRDITQQLYDLSQRQRSDATDQKERIITHAEHVVQSLDKNDVSLIDAVNTIKQCQAQWKKVGKATKDGELWRRFRAPCNAVFEKRGEISQAAAQRQQKLIDNKLHLCEELEQLLKTGAENPNKAFQSLQGIKRKWEAIETTPKDQSANKRFKAVLRDFEAKHYEWINAQKLAQIQLQRQRAKFCREAEQLLWRYTADDITSEKVRIKITEIESQWDNLGSDNTKVGSALNKRFQQSKELVRRSLEKGAFSVGTWLSSVENSNTKNKELLCLKMEILCDVESPEHAKQERLEYQISTMANKMKQQGALEDKKEQIEQLLSEWHLSGIVNPAVADRLELRFNQAAGD